MLPAKQAGAEHLFSKQIKGRRAPHHVTRIGSSLGRPDGGPHIIATRATYARCMSVHTAGKARCPIALTHAKRVPMLPKRLVTRPCTPYMRAPARAHTSIASPATNRRTAPACITGLPVARSLAAPTLMMIGPGWSDTHLSRQKRATTTRSKRLKSSVETCNLLALC